MSKEAVFTMKLEPELRKQFMAEVQATHRPASQVIRDLMRDYIERQRQAREYETFLRTKISAARASLRIGKGRTNEQVEATFAKRRKRVSGKA